MKAEEFISKYVPYFESLLVAEAMNAWKSSISFKLLSSKTENGTIKNRVRCPYCDTEFEFSQQRYSYNSQKPKCPNCAAQVNDCEAEDLQGLSYYGYAAIVDGVNIIVGYARVDGFYHFDSKTFSQAEQGFKFYKGAILRPDSFECFFNDSQGVKRKMSSGSVGDLLSGFRGRRHSYTNLYEVMINSWFTAQGYKTLDNYPWDYENHCSLVKSATQSAKAAAPAKIDSFYESDLPPYPVDEVESLFKKNTFVYTLEEEDNLTGLTESYIRCGNCGEEFYIKDDSHRTYNEYKGSCPHCGVSAKVNLHPMHAPNNQYYENRFGYAVVQEYSGNIIQGDGIMIRYFELEPVITFDADDVPFYSYKHHSKSVVFYGLKKKVFRTFNIYDENTGLFKVDRSSTLPFNFVYVDLPNTKSFLDFSGLKELADYYGKNGTWSANRWTYGRDRLDMTMIRRYIDLRNKYPVMEKLVKCGLVDFAVYLAGGLQRDSIADLDKMIKCDLYADNDSISGFLGLPMHIIKAFKDDIISIKDVLSLRSFVSKFPGISPDLIKYFRSNGIDSDRLSQIAAIANIPCDHIAKYLENVRCFQCYDPSHSIRDWYDYLCLAQKLGMNLKDKYVLYPRSLKRDHDIALKKCSLIKDEKIAEKFGEQVKRAENEYAYKTTTTKFEVRPPKSLEELFEEGRKLSHSVGSYGDAIASGKMCIMFIRKASDPDEPYFTVEINEADKSIVQLRSFSNRLIDVVTEKDLALFIKQWCKMRRLDDSVVLPKNIA